MPDHTTYRVFCRNGEHSCEPVPRLDRKRAELAAQEHADVHGHLCEVVKVQFTTMGQVWPSASAIGASGAKQ
jgi:hypothetical protein